MSKWVHPFIFYGNLWYSMATTRKSSVPDEFGGFTQETLRAEDFLILNLAAEYIIGGRGPWVAFPGSGQFVGHGAAYRP